MLFTSLECETNIPLYSVGFTSILELVWSWRAQPGEAMATSTTTVKAQFADFELDLSSGELTRDGRRSRLQGQPFRLLCVLLEHAGGVVTREELQQQLWPGETFVDFDHGLNKAIAKLREALEDSKASSRLIETIPRRGYRLNVEVGWVDSNVTQPVPQVPPQPRRQSPARYWLVGVLALALVMTLVFSRRTLSGWFGARRTIQSVAVLPLINLSDDPEQEYFADGITEQLITDLSYAKPLRVLSRSSTIAFKGSHLSVPQMADQLHVDALIEGTVLRENDTVRVTVRLTAARPERQLWAASYERKVSDAITLQNQLAADAVRQIRGQLTPEGQTQLDMERRINPEAYDEYLQARFLMHQESAQKDKAIPHLERAIRLDPNFAAAYAALGEAWGLQGVWERAHNRESYATALEYSQKAVGLDPASSEAYSSLGHSLMQSRRWKEAEVALRHALKLDPNNPYAAEYLALALDQKGRLEESLRISHDLAVANPVAVDFRRFYPMVLVHMHRYDEAIAECQRLIALDPNHLPTYETYGAALVEKGRFQEAQAAYDHSHLGIDPGMHAWLYARQGNTAAARQILKDNASSPINPRTAVAHYLIGDQELGLAELDYLANERWFIKTYLLRVDPMFDPMRNDPRFTAIVRKTGLFDN
jgi:TolB-like protein/DNA-binding winged helix-turn-helix (wHTH) protein/Flp pilus assembly protein TadD